MTCWPRTACPCSPVASPRPRSRRRRSPARSPAGRRQGAGEGRRPRQGRWRQARRQPRGRQGPRPGHPRPRHQGAHHPQGDGRPGQRHRRGVLLLLPARPLQPHLPGHGLEGGRHGDRGARGRPARGAGQHPDRRHPSASTRPRPPRSSTRRTSPPRCATRSSPSPSSCGRSSRKEDATLVEVNPLAKAPDGTVLALDAQGHPRRERRLPAARARRPRGRRRRRPARGRGQGEGPQLRQARGRGRHHRQRCRPGHEHPGRRRLRRRGVRRGPAGQLPRHRRRRLGRGHGQRAATSSCPTRP